MAQYKLPTESVIAFDYNFNKYVELQSQILRVIPWVDKPIALGTEFYYAAKPQRPTTGKMFATEAQREIQHTELTAKSVAIWHDLEIPDVEMRILANKGMSIEGSWAAIGAQQLMQQVAYCIYMGDTKTEMVGLFSAAGATTTYDTVKWNAATGPHLTISDMLYNQSVLWSDGFTPPYTLVLSDNLKFGTTVTINATPVTKITNGDMMVDLINDDDSGDRSRLFYEKIGTNNATGTEIYPFEAATGGDDGRALLMKPVEGGDWFIRGVWFQRPHNTGWSFDPKTDRWHTRMKCMITLEVKSDQAISAHTSVNLA